MEVSQITTRKVTRTHILANISLSQLSLPFILLLQGVTSLLALRNTAFQDEALYLLAGRQIFNSWIGGPHFLEPYGLYFSGYPSFYPVIGGVLDILGGVELARLFSLICMLGVTACVYSITRHLFDRGNALVAATLFASLAPVLFLGRLATYDALCMLLIASAMILAMRVSIARTPWTALAIGPLLFLAVMAKYAGLLFVPTVFCTLIWCSLKEQGWWKMLAHIGLTFFSFAVIGVITFIYMDKTVLTGLGFTTTNRVSFIKTSPIMLLQHIAVLGGIIFALALLGLVFSGRHRIMGLLLYGSALLAPAYHIYKGELVSLEKHVAFSMFFIVPLAALAITRLAGYQQNRSVGRYWLAGLAICLIVFSLGLQQAQNMYSGWATSSNLIALYKSQVRLGSGRYLAEDFEVSRYYLQNVCYPWQWSSLDYFTYTDKQKHVLFGESAYHSAIQEGYFDLVELSYGYNAQLAVFIENELRASKKYDLIARIPYHNAYGDGYYWMWRKHVDSPRSLSS
jgi:4-amino-4-deoxy-L-arabinose transferase-like glycosyltransferase